MKNISLVAIPIFVIVLSAIVTTLLFAEPAKAGNFGGGGAGGNFGTCPQGQHRGDPDRGEDRNYCYTYSGPPSCPQGQSPGSPGGLWGATDENYCYRTVPRPDGTFSAIREGASRQSVRQQALGSQQGGTNNAGGTSNPGGNAGAGSAGSSGSKTCGGVDVAFLTCKVDTKGDAVQRSALWAILQMVLNIMIGLVGIAAVGGLVYAAIMYSSAQDNASQVQQAKDTIRNVIIGVVMFLFMWSGLQYLIPGGIFG